MPRRDLGLEILQGIREIKAYKAGKINLRTTAVLPTIPSLADVHNLAARLHTVGASYRGRVWGWEATYEPELSEEAAEVEIPDDNGGFTTQVMPLWSPASFTIGESGVWFFSMSWENGADQPPVEFLDDRNVLD
jgi:hypothetical protein